MAKERKTRQATKSKIDTSKLKKFGSKYKSRGEQKLAFAKRVKKEADDVQSQIVEEQEKAQEKSLWSSIGGALGGLALGLATGGLGWVAAGVGAGIGTYGGAHAGKLASESKSGKRKEIKSDMFYESEAEKQNLAFRDFDDKLNEGILNRSLAAGVMAAAFTGGGEMVKKLKEGKKVREAARAAEASKKAKDALGLPQQLEQAQKGAEFVMNADMSSLGKSGADLASNIATKPSIVSETGAAMSFDDILWEGTDEQLSNALSGNFDIASSNTSAFADSNLSLIEGSPSLGTSSFTPLADEAAPSIMDSYFTGLADQKSKSMQQSLLAAGGMGLYGYRPELESLRKIQFGTSVKPYG
jgi:hypothetical protein